MHCDSLMRGAFIAKSRRLRFPLAYCGSFTVSLSRPTRRDLYAALPSHLETLVRRDRRGQQPIPGGDRRTRSVRRQCRGRRCGSRGRSTAGYQSEPKDRSREGGEEGHEEAPPAFAGGAREACAEPRESACSPRREGPRREAGRKDHEIGKEGLEARRQEAL